VDEYERASILLRALSHPVRLQIIEALARAGEACVCHLEWALDQRQPQVSQHLMRLKEAGLVKGRREGLNIFYSLVDRETPAVLESSLRVAEKQAARESGRRIARRRAPERDRACPCPKCNPVLATTTS
jgi:ArsR family transcriptional regulator